MPVQHAFVRLLQDTRFGGTAIWLDKKKQKYRRGALDERGDASDPFPDDQLVNVVRAFIGENAFEIVHVAHDAVIVDDAVGAKDVPGLARDFQSDVYIIHLQHGDVCGVQLAVVF